MSRYICPRVPIRERYIHHPKGHFLEGLILVGESNRSLRMKGVEVPVYYFFHGDFPDVEFFSLQHYIHVMEEITEECLFDHAEAPDCKRAAIQYVHGTEI